MVKTTGNYQPLPRKWQKTQWQRDRWDLRLARCTLVWVAAELSWVG